MYELTLEELYNFLIEEAEMPSFMDCNETIDLVPVPNVEYRDKIKGVMVSLALGDTHATETAIALAESLIICQGFNPENIGNRFVRQFTYQRGNTMKDFITNYQEGKNKWYKNAIVSAENEGALRCAPIAAVNYGDFNSLKLMAGIQGSITHRDEMTIASSIAQGTAIAYLMNLPPFSLKEQEDLYQFIHICSKSIKGIETNVYRTKGNQQIVNLYTRLSIDLIEAIKKNLGIDEIKEKWGSGSHILESLPYAFYIFLKSPNNYEEILKNSLLAKDTDTVASLALTLAGAYLGLHNIPRGYMRKLKNLEEILIISQRLFELSLKNKNNNPYRKRRENINLTIYQDEIDKLIWQGIKYNNEGEYRDAVKHFESLISKYPEIKKNEKIKLHIIEAYEGLGTKRLGEEGYEEALKYFKRALAYDLNNPGILCDLAITYLNLDDLKKAEKYVRRSVEISPEYQIGREVLDAITSLKK